MLKKQDSDRLKRLKIWRYSLGWWYSWSFDPVQSRIFTTECVFLLFVFWRLGFLIYSFLWNVTFPEPFHFLLMLFFQCLFFAAFAVVPISLGDLFYYCFSFVYIRVISQNSRLRISYHFYLGVFETIFYFASNVDCRYFLPNFHRPVDFYLSKEELYEVEPLKSRWPRFSVPHHIFNYVLRVVLRPSIS